MCVSAEHRVELHLQALKRIAVSSENDLRRFLLAECAEAYVKLDDAERSRVAALMKTIPFQEVGPLMITTYERGKMAGKLEGKLEGKMEMLLALLEARFGPLPPDVLQRVATLNPEQLGRLSLDLFKSTSLKDLHLQD